MDNLARLEQTREGDYQVLFGVHREIFDRALEILKLDFVHRHELGRRPPRLSVLDKLIVFFGYYHDYRTMQNLAFEYGVSKSRISDAVDWVETTLIKDGTFSLPSKRALVQRASGIMLAIIDATECETERP